MHKCESESSPFTFTLGWANETPRPVCLLSSENRRGTKGKVTLVTCMRRYPPTHEHQLLSVDGDVVTLVKKEPSSPRSGDADSKQTTMELSSEDEFCGYFSAITALTQCALALAAVKQKKKEPKRLWMRKWLQRKDKNKSESNFG
ncbi:uncharacterized protein LOC125047933 [Penaeus chinensis]|uniref:uncharacterized protein LOC125047933 n=1 Tax=Penaeus chinensis TaxID=139456 RepID=UPI001FB57946|nr:uncharacterized protein LOC125047933 [Penaeus chinensis]